jgi:serine/threonine protein kinase
VFFIIDCHRIETGARPYPDRMAEISIRGALHCQVSKDSREPEILRFFKEKTISHSKHIITLIETVESSSEIWIILPKLNPISKFSPCRNVTESLEYSHHLVAGLVHMHQHKIAHLDLKPDNLAFDIGNRCLVILDFDAAVMLDDENQELVGYRGTEKWTVPEVGRQDDKEVKFRPIPVDLWACGRLIDFFFMTEKNHRLRYLTEQLLSVSPDKRPSMMQCLDWIERLAEGDLSPQSKAIEIKPLNQLGIMRHASTEDFSDLERPLKRYRMK